MIIIHQNERPWPFGRDEVLSLVRKQTKKKKTSNALFEIIGERERTQMSLCLNKQEGRDLAELI